MDNLFGPKQVAGGHTGASAADVEGLGQFDKLRAGTVGGAKKDGYLKPNAGGAARLRGIHARTAFDKIRMHTHPLLVPMN